MALTDIIKPRICELGKIKIGGKSAQVRKTKDGREWRAPEKHDYFTVTTLNRDASGNLMADKALMDVLVRDHGDADGKVRRLPIALLSNEIDDILQASYVWYSGKRVAARSDGVRVTKFFSNGQWLSEPLDEEWKPEYLNMERGGQKCFKMHATFNCAIAIPGAHWGGVYKFRTTSRITAEQLHGSLVALKQLTGNILRGIPLRLVIRPMQVSPGGITTTVYVVHCELVGDDLLSIQRMAMERASSELSYARQLEQSRIAYSRLLKAPGFEESDEEQADVADEFHPEEPEGAVIENAPPAVDPLMQQLMGGTVPLSTPAPSGPEPTSNDDASSQQFPDEFADEAPPDDVYDQQAAPRDANDLLADYKAWIQDAGERNDRKGLEDLWRKALAEKQGDFFESNVMDCLRAAGYDPAPPVRPSVKKSPVKSKR